MLARHRAGRLATCSMTSGKIGQYLRENEWLMGDQAAHRHSRRRLRVRPALLPLLAAPARPRRGAATSTAWLAPFLPMRDGIAHHPAHPARERQAPASSCRAAGRLPADAGREARADAARAARRRDFAACRRSAPTSTRSTSASPRRTACSAARERRRRPLRADVLQPVMRRRIQAAAGQLPALRQGSRVEHRQSLSAVLLRALQADRPGPVGHRVLPDPARRERPRQRARERDSQGNRNPPA